MATADHELLMALANHARIGRPDIKALIEKIEPTKKEPEPEPDETPHPVRQHHK